MGTYLKRYGLFGTIALALHVLRTRIFFPGVRIIRFPFEIRNRANIDLGKGLTTGFGCRIEAYPDTAFSGIAIRIGNDVELNDHVHIVARASVTIGNNVLMASKIFITDLNHGSYGGTGIHDHPDVPPGKRPLSSSPVVIEDNVWIGEFVSVLPGVTIGKGSIIGTMSVVNKNIPEYCIAAGAPARVIKRFDFTTSKWVKVS